ncbi:hypothetical protein GUITHDRAFT_117106 [Guillardia theta CCMP2712]|uniref:Uncharacterized protein n=1 Tax=Guillardia theta (strain CCMP2712) TaxID=905079 RepID=L1IKB2_GUITC|nr:hypothetical protein GUITHDRAFT_117106 [Guillardia theta CCMP2712]EKX36681.1 hypothetical protein GUITHDRAFT_117106 [Guillardia theta CCMP2712]|eukprot:XP_005823661.1 hypothetical protein GUITHDRAFT_117106 [Guillardia theta CCMP2712]
MQCDQKAGWTRFERRACLQCRQRANPGAVHLFPQRINISLDPVQLNRAAGAPTPFPAPAALGALNPEQLAAYNNILEGFNTSNLQNNSTNNNSSSNNNNNSSSSVPVQHRGANVIEALRSAGLSQNEINEVYPKLVAAGVQTTADFKFIRDLSELGDLSLSIVSKRKLADCL